MVVASNYDHNGPLQIFQIGPERDHKCSKKTRAFLSQSILVLTFSFARKLCPINPSQILALVPTTGLMEVFFTSQPSHFLLASLMYWANGTKYEAYTFF